MPIDGSAGLKGLSISRPPSYTEDIDLPEPKMGVRTLAAIFAVPLVLAGCKHRPRPGEEAEARLRGLGLSITRTADLPRTAARTQIAESVAKARNYPEPFVVTGLINPRITEAEISGPYTDDSAISKGTYYCVSYLTSRPTMSVRVSLRAYPMTAAGEGKKRAEYIKVSKGNYSDCPTPYEPFPELEKRRDEIIKFRKAHPGALKDITVSGMGQL